MSIPRRSYVPRRRLKVRWRIVAPLLLLAALLLYSLITFFWPKHIVEPIIPFTICDFSASKTQSVLNGKSYTDTLPMEDYLLYGETLNLFQSNYQIDAKDSLVGKTLKLVNVCDKTELVYLLEGKADGMIPMENLSPGFYEVFVVQDLISKRMISTEKVSASFNTIRRVEGIGKTVDLVADARLVNTAGDQPALMDQNYVFLRVREEMVDNKIADIYIDAGHNTHSGNGIETGRNVNGLIEAEETYKMSLLLKAEFEKYGLSVVLARDNEEDVIDQYGINGRLHKAYKSQAKYYIEVQLNGSTNASIRGEQIFYSSFATNRLATTVFKAMMEVPGFVATSNQSYGNIKGVNACTRDGGLDARPIIRESGGRILSAGTYSELSREGNASFAAEAILGMQTLTIEYGFLTNAADAAFWKNNKELLAQKTVEGFVKHLQLVNSNP
ncbi:MAG: N-acetylmuramoyl-L-alanine amidase [Erysipelotrichales bacterium]|nr:MAG: N-acetylmuramoyl-L-alanine amidase [Erysipelotrichales bacterium]